MCVMKPVTYLSELSFFPCFFVTTDAEVDVVRDVQICMEGFFLFCDHYFDFVNVCFYLFFCVFTRVIIYRFFTCNKLLIYFLFHLYPLISKLLYYSCIYTFSWGSEFCFGPIYWLVDFGLEVWFSIVYGLKIIRIVGLLFFG